MKNKKEEPDLCEVPRWQMIKATLNNLNFADFVKQANADEDGVMIDVRTDAEHSEDFIPGSTVIDYLDRNLADKIEQLDRSKNYYVYCRTGRRSLRVCVILRNQGFKQIYNLDGGIVSRPPQT